MHGATMKIMSVCLYSCLSYPACKLHFSGPLCIVFLWLSAVRFHIISYKSNIFRKKNIGHKLCFISSTKPALNISHYTKNSARWCHKFNKCIHVNYLLFLSDFNQILIFSAYFSKFLNIKFHKKPSSGSQVGTLLSPPKLLRLSTSLRHRKHD